MNNQLVNFYSKIGGKVGTAVDTKTFKNHHIYNNSMTLCIGGTGTGKTNALLNYIGLSSGEFYKIIICSFSTTDEPLYQYLKEKDSRVELINTIEDVPNLHDFDDKNKDKPKLIVFDDFINLTNKQMEKINDYLVAGRKFSFACWLLAQNYTSVPKIISRNVQYFIIFKLNDNVSIDRILRNHNITDVDPQIVKKVYHACTADKMNFFMIDTKTSNTNERFRKNFKGFIKI